MNKELHKHLSEAARDIRKNLDGARRTAHDIEPTEDNAFALGSIDGSMAMMERALTRIEMALKDATIS